MTADRGVLLDLEAADTGDLVLDDLYRVLPDWSIHGRTRPGELAARISEATVVVSNKVVLDREALAGAGRLRLACIAATGTNNVDLDAAGELGISVCNVNRYATASVAQHVFALLLALQTHLPEYAAAVRDGRWRQSERFCLLDYPIAELAGGTLGIVGYGELGRAVARVAEAFGMNVLVAQRPGTEAVESGRVALDAAFPYSRDHLAYPEHMDEGLEPHKIEDIWLFRPQEPDMYVDVTDYFETRQNALHSHVSQVGPRDPERD